MIGVLIFGILIPKLVLGNKQNVNPSSVSVTRFIESKFLRRNEKEYSPVNATITNPDNHIENQYDTSQ